MLTLKQLIKALNQVAIDREDLLDKPILGDFDSSDDGYFRLGIVDIVGSYTSQIVKIEFVEE